MEHARRAVAAASVVATISLGGTRAWSDAHATNKNAGTSATSNTSNTSSSGNSATPGCSRPACSDAASRPRGS